MPVAYATVMLASSTRMRTGNHSEKAAPLTAEQLKEKHTARNDKQWMESTNELANTIATEFNMEPCYFLDIFFQGSAHMINHQDIINPYNAFRGLKSMEVRERPCYERPRAPYLFFDEYCELTTSEKEALCTRWETVRSTNFHLHRDTPPRHATCEDSGCGKHMKMLLSALAHCVGVEGFLCVVKNNIAFQMEPEWYFTCKELEEYMEIATRKKWVTGEVGMKLEAFGIMGCDPANMLRTSKQKTNWMKGEIQSLLGKNLVDVSKVSQARLEWKWWEGDVVQWYGVFLDG
ncbi:hypothetical protein B0H14DRAFT_2630018 [Mycena olivaceomarginata]|nr:hypothetical protein B0H14DRAFT_2630018 [Mycena olivaceomarginata]